MKNTCLECNSKEQLWIYEKAEGNKLEYVTLCWRCGKKARLDPNDNGKYKWVYYPDQKK
jgi:hypothetical protein